MKSRTSFAISMLSIAVALSFDASAVQEPPPAGESPNTGTATIPATTTATTSRHSHMTEKLGVPTQQVVPPASDDKAAAKEKSRIERHNHQRDMK
ncbi:hypothetical protein GPA22_20370 [Aromatoleum toluvorans]|uniref:Secreted protein n=1 Tax=Aromatoleum toluvorans TaxID=92002 RepID=A0ABX1Q353_9RHOO|nr:hypothetical protein [Aromatoleum toluvorans]NMG46078.1 hypothetical protein [Aromatoleum toluvorans]